MKQRDTLDDEPTDRKHFYYRYLPASKTRKRKQDNINIPRNMLLKYLLSAFILLIFVSDKVSSQHPMSEKVPSPIYSFPANKNGPAKYVALTFDDGPHNILTHDLLDALKKINAKVTFFVMGIKVIMHPDIVARAYKEGHEIANHVWNHPVLSKISWKDVDKQLADTSQAIFNATSITPKVMRPPYGNTNPKLNRHIANDQKYPVIMWSLDTNDWRRPGSPEIVKRIMAKVEDGTVILCHDIHPGTIQAIPNAIEELRKKGFELKTVSEMIDIHYLSNK
jgi:peptidoglycan/xylan/chitin deacetylase (PgdA/CDA1 family)